ncbi:diadenosine tetraphosphate hydrolase [Streptomyces sp. AA1529]|uniref:diadenosine tetraphosphate hydrolase n=1 Tax=Streptomyces sp. AA1529 TaxID=1203257 RepID=UPI0019EAFE22|nr:diadenosine tetraphosphate hydrolase [Streptomyces sp. GKU 257-1]
MPTRPRRRAPDWAVRPGYSVLLGDEPDVQRLSDLPKAKRLSFLSDMDQLGEAAERACRRLDPAFRRANLEILGNTDPFLHVHVWPRFDWEPADLVGKPVRLHPRKRWSDEQFRLGPQHDVSRDANGNELDHLRSVT